MTGLEIIKAPDITAGEIADIVSQQCPPVIPGTCDRLSCRVCWMAWLTTGKPPKEKGPSDEQTAPGDAPTYYRPPAQAIQEAAERVRAGRLEHAAEALTRHSGSEGSRQP